MILTLHIMAIGIWVGCILTEGVMEASREKDLQHHKSISSMHTKIDLFVEGPALIVLFVTGLIMFTQGDQPNIIRVKAIIGMVAIALNCVCFYLIAKRDRLFAAGDDEQAIKMAKVQDAVGGLMILCIIAALTIGLVY